MKDYNKFKVIFIMYCVIIMAPIFDMILHKYIKIFLGPLIVSIYFFTGFLFDLPRYFHGWLNDIIKILISLGWFIFFLFINIKFLYCI